jgi:galactofuranose transport system permease protein
MSVQALPRPRPLSRSFGRYLPVTATGVLLLVAIAIGGLIYDNFVTGQVLANILITNSHLIALAVGMTFVILTGGIDLSVGAVVALSAMIAARLMDAGWPAAATIPVVLLTGSLLGLLVGMMIHYFRIQPFIATLAAMFLARGMCYVISIESIPINERFFVYMSRKRLSVLPNTTITLGVLIALGMVVAGFYVLHYTRFGRTVYAIGGSEPSAMLMGLPVPRVKVSVYVISGFCASLGGMLYTFNAVQSGNPLHAIGMELDAIAAVAIGGTLLTGGYGFIIGSLLGVLVIGTISSIIRFSGTLNSGWTRIASGLLVLGFIVMQRVITLGRDRRA